MQHWYCTWYQRRLFTISLFILEAFAALLSSVHLVHTNSEQWRMVSKSVPQTKWTSILDTLDLRPGFCTSKNFFHNFWGVVCAYRFIFKLTIFSEWAKCHVYTQWFCSASWLVPPEQDIRSNVFHGCYQALSSPIFKESLGMRLETSLNMWLYSNISSLYSSHANCITASSQENEDGWQSRSNWRLSNESY